MRNSKIAVAIATALSLGGFGLAQATQPTPAQASTATVQIFMAGSSAAAAGVLTFLENTVFGGSFSVFTTPTTAVGLGDFRAVSGTAASGQPFAGSTLTVWYRPEGGSVVGDFPVINNISIKQMDIQNAGCTSTAAGVYTCTGVTGTASANGTNDTWGGGVLSHNVDIGVSDLEPGVFGQTSIGTTNAWAGGGNNDPVGTYAASFTGPDQSVSALQAMKHDIIFQQTFGFIASSNLGITDLPREQIAAIFDGLIGNWNQVATGANTALASATIIVCNRELGSGTRASADIFLNGTGCNGVGAVNSLAEVAGGAQPADNFQTIAELDCVNSHSNAIGYVSVDNFSKVGSGKSFPNVVALTVSGVTASAQNSGLGVYGDVYEASLTENTSASANGKTFYGDLVTALQNVNTTSNSAQITAIPGFASNVASAPLQSGSPSGVKTSDFTRGASGGGNSCTPLTHL
jgi:ABC-type phosphate transport system substrate-binding protein